MANSRSEKIILGEEVMSNEDLLLEVLLRLPAKSLIKFKCVSKHWLSLISDPKFGSRHTRLNPSPLTLGFYLDDSYKYGLRSVSLNQAHQKNLPSLAFINNATPSLYSDRPKIMHACNGLILCSYGCQSPYFVCNLTTQKTTILPQLVVPSCEGYPTDNSAYLVNDLSKVPHFKVVLLDMTTCKNDTTFRYDLCHEIDVYSSENGVWKKFLLRARHGFPLTWKAVCDGSLHWITTKKFHARFEVDTLKLVSNPMPSEPTMYMERIGYFGECGGHLFFIYVSWRNTKPFHVFELDKDHNCWKMKYSVNLNLIIAAYPDPWKFLILCLVKEDDINEFSVMLLIPGKIVKYNLRKNTFKVLEELTMKDFSWGDHYYFTQTFPFMSTLFPV